jgi:hypothetical protein
MQNDMLQSNSVHPTLGSEILSELTIVQTISETSTHEGKQSIHGITIFISATRTIECREKASWFSQWAPFESHSGS